MAITLNINSIDRTNYIEFGSIKKRDTINASPDILMFNIKNAGNKSYKPEIGQEVTLYNGATKIFGGVITRIMQRVDGAKNIVYMVTCNDYRKFLDRQLVTNRFEDTTVEDIISSIITEQAPTFTTNNVDCGIEVKAITFNRSTVSEVIQKLAEVTSYSWYVDYDKDIHFFSKQVNDAPFDLTDTNGNYDYKSLQITEDISQIRNSVLVQGGEVEGEQRTLTRLGSELSDEGTLNLEYKFAEKPTVTVDGTAQTVGIDFLDDDADFDVMWSYQQKYLRWTDGNEPTSGQEIIVTGIPLIPVAVRVTEDDSIAEFGTYEHAITDKNIRSTTEAIRRAQAELTAYANDLVEGQFITKTDGLRSGMIINIQSDIRNIDEDVLIQDVTFSQVDPLGNENGYVVKFATLKTIGIIDFLQGQLRDGDITENEVETLLSLLQLADSFTMSDSLSNATAQTGPYKWTPTASPFDWNFATWA